MQDAGDDALPLGLPQKSSCGICCDDSNTSVACLPCGHGPYCGDCVQSYASAKLASGSSQLPCPEDGCDKSVPDHLLRGFFGLAEELIDKFHQRSIAEAIGAATDLYACPTPDCSMVIEMLPSPCAPVLKFECTMCGVSSCLRCGHQPYHDSDDSICSPCALDDSLASWVAQVGAKRCPQCHAVVTKHGLENQTGETDECHKMICRNCSTRFCFKCLTLLMGGNKPCNCTDPEHGFAHPETGDFVAHDEDYISETALGWQWVWPSLQIEHVFEHAVYGSSESARVAAYDRQREARTQHSKLQELQRPNLEKLLRGKEKRGSKAELVARAMRNAFTPSQGETMKSVQASKQTSQTRASNMPSTSSAAQQPVKKQTKLEDFTKNVVLSVGVANALVANDAPSGRETSENSPPTSLQSTSSSTAT